MFYPADPIAYRLNPCVDARRAEELAPSAIKSITEGLVASVSNRFGRFIRDVPLPALPGVFSPRSSSPAVSGGSEAGAAARRGSAGAQERDRADDRGGSVHGRRDALRMTAAQEHGAGGEARVVGVRAERRFAALNAHGTLDFFLPAEGALSEYIGARAARCPVRGADACARTDMVTAHASYWSDATFAAFVLAEIFAKKEDRARTELAAAAARDLGA